MENNKQNNSPVGFTMKLAQNLNALNNYSNLSNDQKNEINMYIKASSTGNDAENRIKQIISKLENNNINNLF